MHESNDFNFEKNSQYDCVCVCARAVCSGNVLCDLLRLDNGNLVAQIPKIYFMVYEMFPHMKTKKQQNKTKPKK